MSEASNAEVVPLLQDQFESAAKAEKPKARKKRPAPISLRLSHGEREKLETLAGSQSLNGYIRQQLFGCDVKPRRRVSEHVLADRKLAAQLLRAIGQWDMRWALQELDLAVRDGIVHLDERTCAALRQACGDVFAMRRDLVKALGLKSENAE
jgi:hypothetical protein